MEMKARRPNPFPDPELQLGSYGLLESQGPPEWQDRRSKMLASSLSSVLSSSSSAEVETKTSANGDDENDGDEENAIVLIRDCLQHLRDSLRQICTESRLKKNKKKKRENNCSSKSLGIEYTLGGTESAELSSSDSVSSYCILLISLFHVI
jgi:hypothetical protein